MENTTALMDATQTRLTARSPALAVFAGGADRLDGALEHAVAPAIERAAPERWSFVRRTGDGEPHVRLAIGGEQWGKAEIDELAEHVSAGLKRATAAPRREPLLPRPASRRGDTSRVGVERIELAAQDVPTGGLHQLASEVVLAALPELEDGRTRCAYGLSLMATISHAALGRRAGPELWRDAARRRTTTDARGQRLLASVAGQAGEIGGELVELAHDLRREGATADGLARLAGACRDLATPAAVRRQAHLTCNRLGVTPLEEVLLALVLAGAEGRPRRAGRAVVELEDVSKQHGERTVLRDVSLTVHEGDVFAIVGPPGSGKSSLLGIAAGLRVASGGSVRVLGQDPREARLLADAPALAIPDAELADERTARENVELHLGTANGAGIVDAVLEEAGLHEHAGTAVAELRAGQRRRLAIACALAHEPAVLLLDEPTAGLAAVDRDDVWRVIGRRREHGATTILATTSLQEALCAGDHAALIDEGTLRAVGAPAQLADEHFPEGVLHFHVVERPDRMLLEELPEVHRVEIDERADHWAVEIATPQPHELLALLEADPDFPEILNADEASLNGPAPTTTEAVT